MYKALKRLIANGRALPVIVTVLLLAGCGACVAASTTSGYITEYSGLHNELKEGVTLITNFSTNVTISLTSAGETFQIANTVTIDGGSSNVIIDGSSSTRLFVVLPGAKLTLNNLQLLGGIATAGGAIYNEGTLIISNCIISGNAATNINGVNGISSTSGNDGGGASSGGSALGGAIYSIGPVSIYYSVLGTNSASGGAGGNGGNGGDGTFFAGNGGNGGNGGSAYGAAVYSTGKTNVFFADEFIDNQCTAAPGGSGGGSGTGPWAGSSGQGGTGGSASGGALFISGNVFISNCLFNLNSATAGSSGPAQVTFTGSGPDGNTGGSAAGGGLFVTSAAARAFIQNSVFFFNTCTGGGGGSAPASGSTGGSGGSAIGGGLYSSAAQATVSFCTLVTNKLAGGTNGTGSGGPGSYGGTAGWDLCQSPGVLTMSGSIISGGTNQAPNNTPNAIGVTDGGYNISSDASMARLASTTLINTDPNLDTALSAPGGPSLGPAGVTGPAMLTLQIEGPPSEQFVPGVPGISFPPTDELLNPRGTPTASGAFEMDSITIATNEVPTILTQPEATNAVTLGATTTFSVSVNDTFTNTSTVTNGTSNTVTTTTITPVIGYQWQFNGNNIHDNTTYSGVNTNNLTIRNIGLAQQGAYQVIVGVSTLQGVVTSTVAQLVVEEAPKITVQPTSKTAVPSGAITTFSVTATPQGLSYQWSGPGVASASGTNTSTLVFDPATSADDGTYQVLVSNPYGQVSSAVVSLHVVPDVTRPAVSITSPAPNARTTNFVISGKATDNARAIRVLWAATNFNNGAITPAGGFGTFSSNGTTARTWSIANAVLPGTNIIAVRSVDYSGNVSPIVTEKFFYVSNATFGLTISNAGSGTVKGSASIAGNVAPANGAPLNIGEGYTLTEVPAKNFVFTNWTVLTNGVVGLMTNSTSLHFIMEEGLEVIASFNTNLFVGAAGTYTGLFYNTNDVTEQTAGMVNALTVNSQGGYSAKVSLNGVTYNLSGAFDASGYATKAINSKSTLSMTLDWTGGQINGAVSGPGWTSTLYAEVDATSPTSGEYTLLLEPASSNTVGNVPPGCGYLLLTNHLGHLVFSGALPDGVAIAPAPVLGRLGDVPIFQNLYGNTGLILGWLTFTNDTIEASPLTWIKPTANGFTNLLSVVVSGWTNPPPADLLTEGSLVISNAAIYVSNNVSIVNNKIVQDANAPISYLSGTLAPKNGLITITFPTGVGKTTTTGYAAFLRDSTNAAGYFLYKGQPGAIWLTTP